MCAKLFPVKISFFINPPFVLLVATGRSQLLLYTNGGFYSTVNLYWTPRLSGGLLFTQRKTFELSKVFSLVKNYLNPGGIFVFDINTPYKYEQVLSDNTFVYDQDGIFYVWQNFFDGEYCDFLIDFFVEKDGSYSRFTEEHTQRCHTFKEILSVIEDAGLSLEGVYDELSFSDPVSTSERIFLVVKKD